MVLQQFQIYIRPGFAPGLGLGALQKFAIDFKIFQWKCPLQNENGLALFNMFRDEIPGLYSASNHMGNT